MLVALPVVGYCLLVAFAYMQGIGWRGAMLIAATAWGTLVVLITELLSIRHWLIPEVIATLWLMIDLALVIVLWRTARTIPRTSLSEMRSRLQKMLRELGEIDVALLVATAIVISVVGAVALLSPPNTWDSMEYHMPRVIHWIQNRSVAFYPTHELKQLHMPPGAEYMILHLHVLFGGDRLDNLIQWFGMLGSVVGVTVLAKFMGANRRGQIFTAIFCATIPQGILEASGTKNDYVVALWLVVMACHLLNFRRQPTLLNLYGIGSALGLALLTKGTAYIFAFPVLAILALAWPLKIKLVFLKRLPLVILLAIGLNVGHYVRNMHLSGSPLGPGAESPSGAFKYTNDVFTVATLVSNVTRNLALHLGTPSNAVNTLIEKGVVWIVHAVGGDINDSSTTWTSTTFRVPEMSKHEGTAGNTVHLLLILMALILLMTRGSARLKSTEKEVGVYSVALLVAFLTFCSVFKWQPWHTRLHLPLFVLWSAAVGVILVQALPSVAMNSLCILLLLLSWPAVIENQTRPLAYAGEFNILNADRVAQYFKDRRDIMVSFLAATEFVKKIGCQDNIGLDLSLNRYEYPLLVLLGNENGSKNIRHIGVTNASARYADGIPFKPCAVICTHCLNVPKELEEWVSRKWDEYTVLSGPPTVFENVVVFAQPSFCQAVFLAGWFEIEQSGPDWLRWTDGRGQISVMARQDTSAILSGDINSIQRPNQVDILLNGERIETLSVNWGEWAFRPFGPLRLPLKAGENTIEFVSHNTAITIPTDSRPLAIAVRNLHLQAEGGQICELQP